MPSSTVLNLTDPHEYQTCVRGADLQVFVTARGNFEARLTRIDLDHLWMQRGRLTLPAVTYSAIRTSRSAIVFLADADQPPMLNTGNQVSPGEIVRYAPDAEHHVSSPRDYHCCAMSLTPEDLASFGRAITGRELATPTTTRMVRPSPPLMSRLQSLHKAACDLAESAPDVLAHPAVARALEQKLIGAMVGCLADQTTGESYSSSLPRLRVMQRFERLLEERPGEPVYLTDLCREIGVTDRTLRLHCRQHLGMSPHHYLWLRRMHLVRRALAMADPIAKTVTEIVTEHGFWELGRFAVAYRRLFAEAPSATLRRAPCEVPAAGHHKMPSKFPILP